MRKRVCCRSYGILLALLCVAGISIAQTPTIERLKKSYESAKGKAVRADYAYQLAEVLYGHNLDEGLLYARKSLSLARDAGDDHGNAQALTSIAHYYYYQGDMVTAMLHCRQAIKTAEAEDWNDYPAKTLLMLARIHRVMANFDSALLYIKKAETLVELRKNDGIQAAIWEHRGLLANAFSHNDEALGLLRKSADMYRAQGDTIQLADTWRSIGSVFKDMAAYDSSNFYYDKCEALAQFIDDPLVLMLLSLNRGETNFSLGNFDEAIIHYSEALNLLKDHHYKLYYGIALFKIGEVYENEGIYNEAYEFFYNSLKEYEKINARQEMQRTYTQIGWCYVYQENYALALENAQLSLNIAQQIKDSASWAQNQNLVGYILFKEKKYTEALAHFNQSIAIRRKIKDWYGYSFSLYNEALAYLELGQLKKAHDIFLESIEVDKRTGKKVGLLFTNNTLGLQYAKERNYERAAYHLAEANALARSIPVPTQLLVNYQNYIFLYEAQKNNAKVISYYKLYTGLTDSLSNQISTGRIAKADALFQLQKKANEIALVSKENEVHQERIGLQEKEIIFQRSVIAMTIVGIGVLAVFSIVVYILFRSIKRTKEQLSRRNSEILAQQEEIQAQSEELKESNDKLYSLNGELSDKNEEIEMQSERLKSALDSLENVNDSLEKRVQERTAELNKAYDELETFFYHTSHDFRRPLTTYLGLAELAKATLSDEKALQLFDKVRETTTGLDAMLIKLQSIGNVHYHVVIRDVGLKAMIKGCLEKFHGEIEQRKIKILVKADANTITVNPFLLSVVFENLIENAIQFSQPVKPCIEITTTEDAGLVEIHVKDNGQGIDDRWKPRIFEMYFRGNDTSKGNGLGLYIARRAIEKIGGTLTFTSEAGKGSDFMVRLPVTAGS